MAGAEFVAVDGVGACLDSCTFGDGAPVAFGVTYVVVLATRLTLQFLLRCQRSNGHRLRSCCAFVVEGESAAVPAALSALVVDADVFHVVASERGKRTGL